MFENSKILITGGTGSFGTAVCRRLLRGNIEQIVVFSRDEKKQNDMRVEFNDSRLKFILGDLRDYSAVENVVKGIDLIFHAGALKQVPSCEFFPLEATKTNILGTENVLNAAVKRGVKNVVCLSTDKAVYPINAMGISKAMMEKIAVAKARQSDKTKICITRYGNVMGSRGSVLPLFFQQINNGLPLTITSPNMTRFMMTLEEAIELVLYAFKHGENGDLFVRKSPSVSINNLAEATKLFFNEKDYREEIIGTRHGEKLFEVLLSREEMAIATETNSYFRVSSDKRDLNYANFFELGSANLEETVEYSSHNSERLSVEQMLRLIEKSNIFKGNV